MNMRNISNIKFKILNVFIISSISFSLVGCSASQSAFLNKNSICVQITDSTVITFADKNLEIAIREKIEYPTGDILKDDVDKITNLENTQGKHITNLSGIENLTDLTLLDLSNNEITNLEPLIELTSLTNLSLDNNKIDNIEPLKKLVSLTSLDLANNKIKDFAPISAYYAKLERTDVAAAGVPTIGEEIAPNDQVAMGKSVSASKEVIAVTSSDNLSRGALPKEEVAAKEEAKDVVISAGNQIAMNTPIVSEKEVAVDEKPVTQSQSLPPKEELAVTPADAKVITTTPIIPEKEIIVAPTPIIEAAIILPNQEVAIAASPADILPEQETIKDNDPLLKSEIIVPIKVLTDIVTTPPVDALTTDDATSKALDTNFILPTSDTIKLEEPALTNLSLSELSLARNEIYARHGFVFKTEEIQSYFESKTWYQKDSSYVYDMDDIEFFNIELIKHLEENFSFTVHNKQ